MGKVEEFEGLQKKREDRKKKMENARRIKGTPFEKTKIGEMIKAGAVEYTAKGENKVLKKGPNEARLRLTLEFNLKEGTPYTPDDLTTAMQEFFGEEFDELMNSFDSMFDGFIN